MKDNIVTDDWNDFGYIEIEEAKKLLSHIREIDSNGKVSVFFNRNSGYVFLSDEDYRVWMMTDNDKIEEWYTCPYCGHEGFLDEMMHKPEDKECTEYLKQIFKKESK